MKRRIFALPAVMLAWLVMAWPLEARATRISTFMEGTLVERTSTQWVIATPEGTYWIKLTRPLSWVRRQGGTRVSFWVHVDQIARFRPVKMMSASYLPESAR